MVAVLPFSFFASFLRVFLSAAFRSRLLPTQDVSALPDGKGEEGIASNRALKTSLDLRGIVFGGGGGS